MDQPMDNTFTDMSGQSAGNEGAGTQQKIQQQAQQVQTQLRDSAEKAWQSTSRGIDRVSMYFREKDSQEMVQDLQQVVRKYPGASVVAGLFLGVMIGKLMR